MFFFVEKTSHILNGMRSNFKQYILKEKIIYIQQFYFIFNEVNHFNDSFLMSHNDFI